MQQDIRSSPNTSRIQLGDGTSFLPGTQHESVKKLIDHVLEHGYVILPRLFSEALVEEAKEEVGRLERLEWEGRRREGGRNGFEGFRTRRVSFFPFLLFFSLVLFGGALSSGSSNLLSEVLKAGSDLLTLAGLCISG
jgi:hypothetical protein